MTVLELQQSAERRAEAERLHTFKLAGDAGYLVKSRKTERGAFHKVVTLSDGTVIACDCKGWEYRRACTRAAAVTRRIA